MNMRLHRYIWALPNTLIGLLFVPLALITKGKMEVVDGVLELHGGIISLILRRCVPLRGGVCAMTLGHVVLGLDRRTLSATRRHERVHVRQYEAWGPAFIPVYLVAGLMGMAKGEGVYKGNHFEREAVEQEAIRR
jgi:hypothetical protein